MKIKKILPEQVKDKTLGYKEYRKVLKPAIKMMAAQCNSPETATDCLIKTDFEFEDMKGKKMGLIILGKQSGAWIKCAKDEIKNEKKFTLIAKSYVKTEEDGSLTLVVLPVKGSAKKTMIEKQITKFALKGMPVKLQIGEAAQTEEENTEDNTEETTNQEENLVSSNEETSTDGPTDEQMAKKNKMTARMAKMDEQIKKLKNQFKIS